jgi:hypothetical protein
MRVNIVRSFILPVLRNDNRNRLADRLFASLRHAPRLGAIVGRSYAWVAHNEGAFGATLPVGRFCPRSAPEHDQGGDVRVVRSGKKVSFPMSRHGAILNLGWPLADGNHIEDMPLSIFTL